MDIAWIILTLTFSILLLILLFNKRGKDKSNREINIHEKMVINDFDTNQINTPSLRISLNDDVSLKDVIRIFKDHGIQLNNNGIFEKKINADSTYFVANLNEPGYFKNDRNIRGFTFFYIAKNHIFDRNVSDQMKDDSENILKCFNGVFLENNSEMTSDNEV